MNNQQLEHHAKLEGNLSGFTDGEFMQNPLSSQSRYQSKRQSQKESLNHSIENGEGI